MEIISHVTTVDMLLLAVVRVFQYAIDPSCVWPGLSYVIGQDFESLSLVTHPYLTAENQTAVDIQTF